MCLLGFPAGVNSRWVGGSRLLACVLMLFLFLFSLLYICFDLSCKLSGCSRVEEVPRPRQSTKQILCEYLMKYFRTTHDEQNHIQGGMLFVIVCTEIAITERLIRLPIPIVDDWDRFHLWFEVYNFFQSVERVGV